MNEQQEKTVCIEKLIDLAYQFFLVFLYADFVFNKIFLILFSDKEEEELLLMIKRHYNVFLMLFKLSCDHEQQISLEEPQLKLSSPFANKLYKLHYLKGYSIHLFGFN